MHSHTFLITCKMSMNHLHRLKCSFLSLSPHFSLFLSMQCVASLDISSFNFQIASAFMLPGPAPHFGLPVYPLSINLAPHIAHCGI